jgi:hypothetical protein
LRIFVEIAIPERRRRDGRGVGCYNSIPGSARGEFMRSHEVFVRMTPERAAQVMAVLMEKAPAVYTQAVAVTSAAMNARPKFLMRQPAAKRADMVRRTLARVRVNDLAEEVLATYYLEGRRELLTEWLDSVGLEHDEGILKDENPCPPAKEKLEKATKRFLEGDQVEDRELLLRAFAAQSAIDWPDLAATFEDS